MLDSNSGGHELTWLLSYAVPQEPAGWILWGYNFSVKFSLTQSLGLSPPLDEVWMCQAFTVLFPDLTRI
jgi:hypothetical protein